MSGFPPPPGRFAPPPARPGGFPTSTPNASGMAPGMVPPPGPGPANGNGNGSNMMNPQHHSQPQYQQPQQQQYQQQQQQPNMAQFGQGMANLSMNAQQQHQPQRPGMGFAPPPPPGQLASSSGGSGMAMPLAPPGSMAPHAAGAPMMRPPGGGGFAPPGAGMGFAPPAPGGFAGAGAAAPPGAGSGFGPPPPVGGGMMVPPPAFSDGHAGAMGHHAPAAANHLNAGAPQSPFYQQQPPSQAKLDRVAQMIPGAPLVPGPAGGDFNAVNNNTSMMMNATNEHIDYSVVIPDRLFRWTTSKLPVSAAMANSSKIPFGAVLRPLAPDGDDDTPIATVQPGSAGIVRCKRCRTYMNAFVTWSEHGRRWRCNICAQSNDCPSAYFCHLDEFGLRRDRMERPELSSGVVEFVAPAEYMVRPPQEPAYFFVLDVSATAVRSGLLQSAARAIKSSLDDLPGGNRTKIGFITFDNGVHYFNLSPELASPQMLVVSDLKELFVPLPDNLLVNLQESRSVVDAFLDNLPDMFAKNPVVSQSCLGPALKAAFTVIKQIGGKMSVFQSILPNLGDGSLKPREQPGLVGTPNEMKLLKSDNSWYKDTSIEFSRQQISVDLYIFPFQYMDLATLGELAKFSSGTMHSYVNFNASRDGPRFEAQLVKSLTQTTAFEAVMRIRCTKGMRITNFYGNFYIRGTDLLALPNCNSDSVYAFDLAHDEQNVPVSHVAIQAALLYTSGDGERRIRVMTQALPVTSLTSEMIASIDTDACCALLAKQALDVAQKSSLDNARMRIQQVCVEIIRAAKSGDKRTVSGYSVPPPAPGGAGSDSEEKPIPEHLQLLPLYTLAMMKNVAFRGGTDVHPDERVQSHYYLTGMWVDDSKQFCYPRMFSIHDMDKNAGHPSNQPEQKNSRVAGRNFIQLPEVVNLSVDRLSSNGVFLLDNGVEMYLWVGRSADMSVVSSLFGVHSLDDIDPHQLAVMTSGDPFATRFGAITQALRERDGDPFVINPKFNIVREGDAHMEARFFWFMVEDRASFQGGTHSYTEFMQFVNNPQASAGASGPSGPGRIPIGGIPHAGGGMMPPGRGGMPPPNVGGIGMPPPNVGAMGMQPPHAGGMGMQPPHAGGMGMQPPHAGGMGMQPPHAGGMGMQPPHAGEMGMRPPHAGGMGMQANVGGMGMTPPNPVMGMAPQRMGMPPPRQGVTGGPPPMPGRAVPAPPVAGHPPPPPGGVGGGLHGPPRSAPPPLTPPVNRGPPPPPGAAGGFGEPPHTTAAAGFGGPPHPPAGRAGPPPPPPQRSAMPPPPQRGSMPPPPPPRR